MKLSPYAEKLLAKASSPARCGITAPGEGAASPAPVQVSPALAKLPVRLKVGECAKYLDSSKSAILNFKDSGALRFINIATAGASRPAYRITRESLAAFEQSRKTRPTP